jgi:nickel/cobalt transporter (NicO) family protein
VVGALYARRPSDGRARVDSGLLTLGAFAGAAHVVLAPDHLIALLVFSAEARRRAWQVGLCWGVGHAGAIAGVALVFLEARERLHWDFATRYSDSLGALILIAIGVWGLLHLRGEGRHGRAASDEEHGHGHAHGHGHGHSHGVPGPAGRSGDGHAHTGLAFAAGFAGGLLHSVAGHGVLFATLPALGLERGAAHAYLLAFGCATIAAVTAVCSVLGALAGLPFRRAAVLPHYPRFIAAVAFGSVAFGCVWLALAWAGIELHADPAAEAGSAAAPLR